MGNSIRESILLALEKIKKQSYKISLEYKYSLVEIIDKAYKGEIIHDECEIKLTNDFSQIVFTYDVGNLSITSFYYKIEDMTEKLDGISIVFPDVYDLFDFKSCPDEMYLYDWETRLGIVCNDISISINNPVMLFTLEDYKVRVRIGNMCKI